MSASVWWAPSLVTSSLQVAAAALSTCGATLGLRRKAGLGPAPEHLDPLGRPGAVAGHGAVGEAAEDVGGVCLHVVAGPQVERERHGLAVVLAEQRLDVRLEAHGLVGSGQGDLLGVLGAGRRGLLGGRPARAPVPGGRGCVTGLRAAARLDPENEKIGDLRTALSTAYDERISAFVMDQVGQAWDRNDLEQRGVLRSDYIEHVNRITRDALDSSFDEIVHVHMLRPRESRDLLKRRNTSISDAQALLCHCLSGGLPRDLLRATRLLARVASHLQKAEATEPPQLDEVLHTCWRRT
jgi:hypothetical protein